MSIQTEINRISQAKEDLKNSINAKLTDTQITNENIEEYSSFIDNMSLNENWKLIETFTGDGVNGIFEKTNINLKKTIISIDAKVGTSNKALYPRIKLESDTDYFRCGYISNVVNTTKEYITTILIETQPFLHITSRYYSKPDTSSFNIINVSLPNAFEKKGNIKAISIGHQQEKFVVPEGTIINIYGVEHKYSNSQFDYFLFLL